MAWSAIDEDAARTPRTWASERFAISLREPLGDGAASGDDGGPTSAILVRHMLHGRPDVAWQSPDSVGLTLIDDLRTPPCPWVPRSFHAVDVLIPWAVLDEITERVGAAPLDRLEAPPGVGLADQTIAHLIGAMLPVIRSRQKIAEHYVDHLGVALASHVAHTYGQLRPAERHARGGLAPHVLRRAKAILRENLRSPPPLEEVAEACGFSARHFARAFRDSTGMTPHRWAMSARVAAAKTMMQSRAERLAEIALACGFADQSHLTRVFKRETGASPAVWRRAQVSGAGFRPFSSNGRQDIQSRTPSLA